GNMTLEDSRILFDDSKALLQEIELIYDRDIKAGESSPLLRVRIKQFLDNINSCLDYIAFEVFTTLCAENVKETEGIKKLVFREGRVYFPCLDEPSKFDNYIKDRFPTLEATNRELISIFKKYQPFPTRPKWLKNLKVLVNSNKHRNLSKQQSQHSAMINSLTAANGASISNLRIITDDGVLPFRFVDENGNDSPITSFDGSITIEFIFSEINQPLLPTLKRMLRSIPSLINEVETQLKGA
ncbi:hypothetical protein, partial [Priestia megaterium]|uniref:hypothetical protein n=1 Tax=Priestia megaterium TaxID=1404 RepID=UPI00300BA374